MARFKIAVAVVVTWVVAVPGGTSAQSRCTPTNRLKAVDHARQAKAHMGARAFDKALDELRAAYEVCPTPGLRYAMGRVHEEAGHLADALASFRACITEGAEGDDAEQCGAKVRELQERLAKGTLLVTANAPGAVVIVDGARDGVAAGRAMALAAGRHSVTVRAAGRVPVEAVVDVPGGGEARLDARLDVEPPRPSLLLVRTTPPHADVVVDGVPRGTADGEVIKLDAGLRHVEVRAPGYRGASQDVTLVPGRMAEVVLTLAANDPPPARPVEAVEASAPRSAAWNWVGVGIGSALLAASVYPLVRYGLDRRDARPASDTFSGDTVSPANLIGGTVAAGLGVVAIITSVVLWPKAPAAVSAAPVPGGGAVVLSVGW